MDVIKLVRSMQKTVFSLNEFARILKKPKNYSSIVLGRLKRKGLIRKIERNRYALEDTSDNVIFSNLIYPSYLSFLTAFSYYSLTTQIPKKIHIVSLKSKKELKLDNYILRFIKFKPERMFGYKREKTLKGFVFVAEIEKAIIDSLFLPKYCPVDETYHALSESLKIIDIDKLINYAIRMKNKVILKRIGYLLEKQNIDIYNKIGKKLNNKYDFLDIHLKKGEKNKKWKLVVNRSLG